LSRKIEIYSGHEKIFSSQCLENAFLINILKVYSDPGGASSPRRPQIPKNMSFFANILHRNHFREKYQEGKIVPHQILHEKKSCKIFVQLKISPPERLKFAPKTQKISL